MIVDLDAGSPVPPFEQVREQIAAAAASGALPAGTRLPAIRQLATELGLAAGTVARAYRELEADGVVAGRGRNDTVVLPRAGLTDVDRTAGLAAAAGEFAEAAAELGATRLESLEAVRAVLRNLPG